MFKKGDIIELDENYESDESWIHNNHISYGKEYTVIGVRACSDPDNNKLYGGFLALENDVGYIRECFCVRFKHVNEIEPDDVEFY